MQYVRSKHQVRPERVGAHQGGRGERARAIREGVGMKGKWYDAVRDGMTHNGSGKGSSGEEGRMRAFEELDFIKAKIISFLNSKY